MKKHSSISEMSSQLDQLVAEWRRLQQSDASPGDRIKELREINKKLNSIYVWGDSAVTFDMRSLHTSLRNDVRDSIEALKYY